RFVLADRRREEYDAIDVDNSALIAEAEHITDGSYTIVMEQEIIERSLRGIRQRDLPVWSQQDEGSLGCLHNLGELIVEGNLGVKRKIFAGPFQERRDATSMWGVA